MSEEQHQGSFVVGGDAHVEIGAVALGPHASATANIYHSPGGELSENLASLMRELMAALQQHHGDLADQATAQDAAEQITAELHQASPDKSRIRQLLTKVVTAAGPVAAIAAAVAAVEQAIGSM